MAVSAQRAGSERERTQHSLKQHGSHTCLQRLQKDPHNLCGGNSEERLLLSLGELHFQKPTCIRKKQNYGHDFRFKGNTTSLAYEEQSGLNNRIKTTITA